jgi:DNA-directed RNA polymerase subunit RPC12/RpoP
MGAEVGYSPRVIACPSCPKCGTRMLLVRIFPDSPGHDQRTYECPRCEHEVTEIFQLERKASETA